VLGWQYMFFLKKILEKKVIEPKSGGLAPAALGRWGAKIHHNDPSKKAFISKWR
jgi:hypothetical protein